MEKVLDILEDAKADINLFDEALAVKWVRLSLEQGMDINQVISYANSILWETLK